MDVSGMGEMAYVDGIEHALAQQEEALASARDALFDAQDRLIDAEDRFDNGCVDGADDDDGDDEDSNEHVRTAKREVECLQEKIRGIRQAKRDLLYDLQEAKDAGRWRF